ncbi:S8 family serine peptidase [Paenibacillus koleovorans]|uniref:S8 family serine peptidase n=1 Tax=Paenibacillus koleovorans TaxID=121608 RepID=UPI0013E38742|nr:S8 family serine peptidase [Paenibacillus koleovorans]
MNYRRLGKRLLIPLLVLFGAIAWHTSLPQATPPALDAAEADKIRVLNEYYRVSDLHAKGFTGRGARIAIVAFDTFQRSDIETFSRQFDLPEPDINVISLFGGAIHQGVATDGHKETTLNIDIAHAAAPDAVLDVYSVPPSVPFSILLQAIMDNGQAQLVTFSWGRAPNMRDDERANEVIEEMRKRGITVFASTGNNGATADNKHLLSPSYLPNVVAVGGTVVARDPASGRAVEYDWPLSVGGWSVKYPLPLYQAGAAEKLTAEGRKYRMLPDIVGPSVVVTATESPNSERSGIPIYVTDPLTGEGQWDQATGTSVAAPYVAGIFANIVGGLGRGLGDLHEPLYKLMEQPAFNRVKAGNHEGVFERGDFYSMATGLGSINAYEMAVALGLIPE